MFTLVMIVHIIVSIVLIVSVLLQMGKGASIGSSFGGTSSQTPAAQARLDACQTDDRMRNVFMLIAFLLTTRKQKSSS